MGDQTQARSRSYEARSGCLGGRTKSRQSTFRTKIPGTDTGVWRSQPRYAKGETGRGIGRLLRVAQIHRCLRGDQSQRRLRQTDQRAECADRSVQRAAKFQTCRTGH